MAEHRVVTVGLRSHRDMDVLGQQFSRHFPVSEEDGLFADLLTALDRADPVPVVRMGSRRT